MSRTQRQRSIRAFSGVDIYPLSINDCLGQIRLRDIAHALSMKCRFGGHSPHFYSVAQHSVLCSMMVSGRRDSLLALFHDAAEAYLPDIPRPIKDLVRIGKQSFDQLEHEVLMAIHTMLNIPGRIDSELIRMIDVQMLAVEVRDVLGVEPTEFEALRNVEVPKAVFVREFWMPEEAERRFLMTYENLAA